MLPLKTFCLALVAGLILTASAPAQDLQFFRIGTGGVGGTYFPVGSLIASAISKPPGSRPCDDGGACGVPGLVAVAQTTQGSVENINLIDRGELESGLAQSDVTYWAFYGDNMFSEQGPRSDLRALARLYPEAVHVVVRRDGKLADVEALRGKRISIGAKGSGTAINARIVLTAFGLETGDYVPRHLGPSASADALIAGELDAFFFVGGHPVAAVADLAEEVEIALLPLSGPQIDAMLEDRPFFSRMTIPQGTYAGVAATDTLSVSAQWLVSARLSPELVYQITGALWHESTQTLLQGGHPEARHIQLERALDGINIPLHDGAARYYRERGILD